VSNVNYARPDVATDQARPKPHSAVSNQLRDNYNKPYQTPFRKINRDTYLNVSFSCNFRDLEKIMQILDPEQVIVTGTPQATSTQQTFSHGDPTSPMASPDSSSG
jgi:hypothetical protein